MENSNNNEINTKIKKFTIYWVRHGLSCANVVYLTRKLYLDPDLTYLGYKQLIDTRRKIKELRLKFDYVFCSNLSRAIQSCLILTQKPEIICKMFNKFIFKKEDLPCDDNLPKVEKKTINISPYIKESGFGRDNNPISPEKFLIKYKDLLNSKSKMIDIKVINSKEWSNEPSLLKFIKNIEMIGDINNKNILAVSHTHTISKLIKKYYKGRKDKNFKALNGAIIKADYELYNEEGKERVECKDYEFLHNPEITDKEYENQYVKHCKFNTSKDKIEIK
jgi:broad specificity phosphatase PhoE